MAETFKFPNGGYDVIVCKKQDILDCINDNIVDKEVLSDIIEQCEKDAADFIVNGKWTGLPFIGNVRIPKGRLIEDKLGQKELIEEAKENLSKDKYLLFRKALTKDNATYIKKERYFNYIVTRFANKNKKVYTKLCNKRGERFARIHMYGLGNLVYVGGEINNTNNYEEQFAN